ncbi:MAG: hypothetical protein KAH95_15150 [Spirochaetales bacterium]|nr:hypothetical protein [Spirochaetales bacterium]
MSFLVIDFGTSSCRASIVSNNGQVISRSRETVEVDINGFSAELNCEYVWSIVVRVIENEISKNPNELIDAVGVSSMLGYVFLDSKNEPLRPAITWMDNRAGSEANEIRELLDESSLYSKTGRRLSPELLAPKILWLRKNEEANYKRIKKIIGLKDEIVRRLSGRVGTDYAHLNYTFLYNIGSGKIDEEISSVLNISKDLFPDGESAEEIVGHISRECSQKTGLTVGIPVINGSSDGTTAMYGGGILGQGKAVLVSGTTDVLMMKTEHLVNNKNSVLSINNGMVKSSYVVGGAMGMSGGTLNRISSLFNWNIKKIIGKVKDIKPGAEGLIFTPGLSGERAPYWNDSFTGSIVGLNHFHKPEHIVRALFEGISFRILRLLQVMNESSLFPESINVVGGGASIEILNQIRADVTGLPQTVLKDTEATSLGTAIFCRKGISGSLTLSEASADWIFPLEVYKPNAELHEVYLKQFMVFEKYINAATTIHNRLKEGL